MKRILCLTLIILISFCSCADYVSPEKTILTVLVDTNFNEVCAKPLMEAAEWKYPNIELEFISLPMEGVERETYLQNIRTEIMAGAGPDIFLLSSWNCDDITWNMATGREYPRVEPVFKSVEDSMNNATFLTLDQYIEKSEYINLEDHIKPIMDAGRNDLGQVVLPIHYAVPMFLADKSYLDDSDEIILNGVYFEDCDNEALLYTLQNFLMENWFVYQFAEYEDDNNNLVLKTEELEFAFDVARIVFDAPSGDESIIIHNFEADYTSHYFDEMMMYRFHNNRGEYTPVFLENVDGGVTALIESYAAINNNTDYPEEAFKILELIFCDDIQNGKGFHGGETGDGTIIRYSIDMEPTGFHKNSGILTGKAAFSNEDMYSYSDIEYINSKITHVRFTSEYDVKLTDAWRELDATYHWQTKECSLDYDAMAEEIYSELYSDFKMIAAE